MKISAVKFRENGFCTQPFAFGGEEGTDKFDKNIKYRSGLQNYVIDTGDDVILVDTGFGPDMPEEVPDENAMIYTGKNMGGYLAALANLGYTPDMVTKILVTHRHNDHTGELKSFPNAKIYVNADECDADELKDIPNIIPVQFTDGAYHNFPESQKIVDGVYYIRATGHTRGNSLVIAEDDGLFYMIHGDITYVDEALYENKLSVVFDDIAAARETLNRVREFVSNNPTVYLSTHAPQGYENLNQKRIVDLNNPPETIPVGEFIFKTKSGKYVCSICGYVYDPAVGDVARGIAPGTAFEDLPEDWTCPRCKQPKTRFNPA